MLVLVLELELMLTLREPASLDAMQATKTTTKSAAYKFGKVGKKRQ